MLTCIQSFKVEMRAPHMFMRKLQNGKQDKNEAGNLFASAEQSMSAEVIKNLEVVLIVDELRVISFDRLGMKMPSSLAFDDQVRVYSSVLRHFLMKQLIFT